MSERISGRVQALLDEENAQGERKQNRRLELYPLLVALDDAQIPRYDLEPDARLAEWNRKISSIGRLLKKHGLTGEINRLPPYVVLCNSEDESREESARRLVRTLLVDAGDISEADLLPTTRRLFGSLDRGAAERHLRVLLSLYAALHDLVERLPLREKDGVTYVLTSIPTLTSTPTCAPAKPKKLLTDWHQITAALEMKYADRRTIKRLNDQYDGPIKTDGIGRRPMVGGNDLIEWWNRLDVLHQELTNQREGAKLAAEAGHEFGKSGRVATEVNGSVKKREESALDETYQNLTKSIRVAPFPMNLWRDTRHAHFPRRSRQANGLASGPF